VFAQPGERRLVEQCAATVGVAFHGLFLDADLATRVARIGARSRDASDADAAVARQQDSNDLGELDWRRIDASGTPEQTLAGVRAALGVALNPGRQSR
jgi:predicted kinase